MDDGPSSAETEFLRIQNPVYALFFKQPSDNAAKKFLEMQFITN